MCRLLGTVTYSPFIILRCFGLNHLHFQFLVLCLHLTHQFFHFQFLFLQFIIHSFQLLSHSKTSCQSSQDFLISNQIFSKFWIQLEYEYSVASNSIRILNGVEMSCWDVAPSGARLIGIAAIRGNLFVYFLTQPQKRVLTAAKPILTYLQFICTHQFTK